MELVSYGHGRPSVKRLSVAFWRLRGILPMLAATLFLSSVENNPVVTRTKSMAIKTMLPAFPSSSLSTSLRSLWLGTRAQSQGLVAVTGA
jgi:hypothetical protein